MIKVLDIFSELNSQLIILLESLTKEDWEKKTCISNRNVKDLASHLLDTSLRKLAIQRDGFIYHKPKINSYKDLVDFIQQINRRWIEATRGLSPQIIISLLKNSETELVDFFKTLPPYEKAFFAVDWSGEKESDNWFDIARDYTEKWHHQMQIRYATDKIGKLYEKRFFQPIIDTLIKAVPFTYQKMSRTDFTLNIEITGTCGKLYTIEKSSDSTTFIDNVDSENSISITQEEFWKLVTNSKPKGEITLTQKGDPKITSHFLSTVAVMS